MAVEPTPTSGDSRIWFELSDGESHLDPMAVTCYVDGTLRDPGHARIIEQHCAECELCREQVADARTWPLAMYGGSLHVDVVAIAEYSSSAVESSAVPAIEQHLAGCEECRRLLEELRDINEPLTLEELRGRTKIARSS